jgi:hypothetical protein
MTQAQRGAWPLRRWWPLDDQVFGNRQATKQGYVEVVEHQAHFQDEFPHLTGRRYRRLWVWSVNGEAPKPRDVSRAMTGAYAAAVFVTVPVEAVTIAQNTPVSAVVLDDTLRIGSCVRLVMPKAVWGNSVPSVLRRFRVR